MTRSTAREIAAHLAYELSFTELPIQEFLDQQLSDECFAGRASEYEIYEQTPNEKQKQYIMNSQHKRACFLVQNS